MKASSACEGVGRGRRSGCDCNIILGGGGGGGGGERGDMLFVCFSLYFSILFLFFILLLFCYCGCFLVGGVLVVGVHTREMRQR